MPITRPFEPPDLDQALAVFFDAFEIADTSLEAYLRARFSHLLRTDPQGAWVALDAGGNVGGVATAIRRGSLWALSVLAVAKGAQNRGAGRALFERALGYARPEDARLILSSDDPRAQRLYKHAGLRQRRAHEGKGRIDRARLPASAGVSAAGAESLGLCEEVDRIARGHARRTDLEFMIGPGGRELWVIDDRRGRGYVITGSERLFALAATTEPVARDLLRHALALAGDGDYQVSFVGEQQRWAREVFSEAGIELAPRGAIFTSGAVPRWDLFIPNPALG